MGDGTGRMVEGGTYCDPGRHAARLAALGADPRVAIGTVQGLLIHHDQLARYPVDPGALADRSRETRPAAARLDAVLARDPAALEQPLPYHLRDCGTCRDYAVMLAAFLIAGGRAARVRCGFASYFRPDGWEDHWVTEYRDAGGIWRRADAQLDDVHCNALAIDFDTADLTRDRFLSAAEAGRAVAEGRLDPAGLGHGAARGAWFLRVNLARDLLALQGQEVSAWDGWRAAAAVAGGDDPWPHVADLRAAHEAAAGSGRPQVRVPAPFWL